MQISRPITARQRKALAYIAKNGQSCGDDLNRAGIGNTATMWQLERRGLLKHWSRCFADPAHTQFRITASGRAAIN